MSTLLKKQQIKEIYIKGFEKVLEIIDPVANLHAFIAIHNTRLGPALGGIRMFNYRNREEALTDVLRLASGMTYKWATCSMGLGGGKAVIMGDPKKKTKEQLAAFAHAVNSLSGDYICAEDSGLCQADLEVLRQHTHYIVGIERKGSSGNPCPYTAFGTFRSIQATCKELFGTASLKGRTIAIQGAGNVGTLLAERLFWEGARLVVADLDEEKTAFLAERFNATVVDPIDILSVECDILAPCAMGAVINDETVPLLKCKAVCGSANNMLKETKHATLLKQRNILLAPDFIANAGGAINVASELEEANYDPIRSYKKVDAIFDRMLLIYKMAKNKGMSTQQAAYQLAEFNIANGIGKREKPVIFHH
jgi:leucine dehydrogenase